MAEIKTGIFAKNVQKRLSRAQEKVLQKLGKADETKDEQFEQCVQNFKRQESEGARLQREMRAYLAAVKGMQQASMNLTESLHEVYEPDWHGKDDVMTIGKSCDELWEDFHQRLVDSTIQALENYLTQFPDLKMRVSKRARKLIDYDSARHHLETLQASSIRSDRKIMKAEDDLKKAQKVFDDLNVGLQDELPTLWDSRVGLYVTTFKSVTSLEAKFHREISMLCHKLYEVMNRLAEQHSDKMFTIQGAPRFMRDSGPLRLARTPTPPDDTPPESPDASPNHMLRPTSPGPPRPKSPSQMSDDLKKAGPPVPPPPKVTPTAEVKQEQIIDFFDNAFPVSTPSTQPNERPGESLLDLDFDAFPSTSPGQSTSPMPQNMGWDMWSSNAASAEPAADVGFTVDWSANFTIPSPAPEAPAAAATATTDDGATASAPDEENASAGVAADAAPAADGGWPPATGWAAEAAQPPTEAAAPDETDAAATTPAFAANFDNMPEEGKEAPEAAEASVEAAVASPEAAVTSPEAEAAEAEAVEETEGRATTPPFPVETTSPTSPQGEKAPTPAESPLSVENVEAVQREASLEDKMSPIDEAPAEVAKASGENASGVEMEAKSSQEEAPVEPVTEETAARTNTTNANASATVEGASGSVSQEDKMPIPSVVIEPASSNEGDDDRDGDILSPTTTTSDNGVGPSSSSASSGMPAGFLFKVEAMHDFDAENNDELNLKSGDMVLVIPTRQTEDQDAGWLTGIREVDWLQQGASAKSGLFPENFTQRVD